MQRRHPMPFGAEVLEGGQVRFRLWAPAAKRVELCLEGRSERVVPMRAAPGGWFQLIHDARPGTRYRFRIDRGMRVPDPASRSQPQDVHGPSEVIDPGAFGWSDTAWTGRPWDEAVLYELHVGAFTPAGTFRGAIEKLDHLVELGVTAVELLPVADFPGARGWGYDGVYPFAPESRYGRPEDLKLLVQAAHERGLMVLLDLVMNHFGPEGNYLGSYAPQFFTSRHQTPWGQAIAFEGPRSRPVREFFLNAALYWLEEFHFDGLRFDAVHAIFDKSRPDLLDELAHRVRQGPGRHRQVHLVLENDDNAARYLRPRPPSGASFTAQWNDDLHHALHVLLTGERSRYYQDYADDPLRHLGRCLAEGFAYQGEASPFRGGKKRGESSAGLAPTRFVSFLQNHDQIGNRPTGDRLTTLVPEQALRAAAAVLLLSPQVPLLFMGEEWGCQQPFPYFCDFEPDLAVKVKEGRRAEHAHAAGGLSGPSPRRGGTRLPDPGDARTFETARLDWEELVSKSGSRWLSFYRELLAVRRQSIVPLLSGLGGGAGVKRLGARALTVSWPLHDGGQLTLLANLGPEPLLLGDAPRGTVLYALPGELGEALAARTMPPWAVAWLVEGSVRAVDGPPAPSIPRATYRLQLGSSLSFRKSAELVPYLDRLGVSHCYFSPYLKARAGSPHGYDIVDHGRLNPELGSTGDFEALIARLRRHGMGQIADVVSNHMGVGGDDNRWWLDVLENGQASAHAAYFDIDWSPAKDELRGKLLAPFLGEPYGAALEKGELELKFDEEAGSFDVYYYRHRFPVDPRSYPQILGHGLAELSNARPEAAAELRSLIAALVQVPALGEVLPDRRQRRIFDVAECKRRLAQMCRSSPSLARFVEHNVRRFNGTPGEPASFDLLHALLEAQAYRLAFWKVAANEINYRRFFDVNELAGVRMELPEVFESTHRLIFDLVARGALQGLRIDHPDGLYDPLGYFKRLQQYAASRRPPGAAPLKGKGPGLYVVVEKILASHEHLPEDWPVHGTTGYDFGNLVHGLLVRPEAEGPLDRCYWRFIGHEARFDDLVYEAKKLIAHNSLAGELQVLANRLDRISEADRRTRDFTQAGLREALTEVVACFPVYRSYIEAERVSAGDRQHVTWAVAQAKRRNPARDHHIYDFIQSVLLLEAPKRTDPALLSALTDFVLRFQQFSAPVMAKGLEDTAFYVYNRLLSHNDVGGDPRRFSVSVPAFHHQNLERARRWPCSLLATSTHDSKRSEDGRARLAALSELWREWQLKVFRWSRYNRARKHKSEGGPMPGRNDEYLVYQTLLSVWPAKDPDEGGLAALTSRVEEYLRKAAREAKVHTSWRNPNAAYEDALLGFARALFRPGSRFLDDFLPFERKVAQLGMLNSLSQLLVKLTAPGVPDIYQGNELWDFSLVDPDNRRPVDFEHRRALLEELIAGREAARDKLGSWVAGLLAAPADGRIKLYFTWRVLSLRRRLEGLFREGAYVPLEAFGAREGHLCAFLRRRGSAAVVVVAPRFLAALGGASGTPPASMWSSTWVEAPKVAVPRWVNVLTGEELKAASRDGRPAFGVPALFRSVPYAVLVPASRGRW
ncbi:MAG: malto-oligosyltrehalose synthase [Myxococcaceae bacterium]